MQNLKRSESGTSDLPPLVEGKVLCTKCRYIFNHSWLWPQDPTDLSFCLQEPDNAFHSLCQLVQSARVCLSCDLLLETLGSFDLEKDIDESDRSNSSELMLYKADNGHNIQVSYPIGLEPSGETTNRLAWYSIRDTSCEFASRVALYYTERVRRILRSSASDERETVASIGHKTDSEESWRQVQDWLKKCTSAGRADSVVFSERPHVKCHESILTPRLPGRLIRIVADVEDLCLFETAGLHESANHLTYAALTHCWGDKSAALITTCENVKDMAKSIPFRRLEKIFQDAITICSRLNINYIWIDALCIVQGDADRLGARSNEYGKRIRIMCAQYCGSRLIRR